MKERGIIFNQEMVRAILDGRKTQTRRVVKSVPTTHNFHGWIMCSTQAKDEGKACWAIGDSPLLKDPIRLNCPLGKIGDRLWVRETWMPDALRDGTWSDIDFYDCKDSKLNMIPERFRRQEYCIHRASWKGSELAGWTPSIHMPRWASRILLEITDIRVERIQDASDNDFKAEGYPLERELTGGSLDSFLWFRHLWDSVNKPDCNYESNPWVWVIEFKNIEVKK